MSFSKISALGGLAALASTVSAHGTVTGIVADGIYYEGYSASFQYLQTAPKVVGWSIPEDLSNGFIAPDAYATSDIICHLGATNAQASALVKAGGVVELQWTAWPSSHHGPVIDYLANCGGDCSTVDKTTLEWFKIDAGGLYDDTTVPGDWASDTLIANNNSWSVTIPTDIASGNYVLRHEIIALHSAEESDGAQNYPQCVNLEITGTGTATPSGTLGTALYSETDAGILVNIYASLSTYVIPGPTLYSGAVSMSQTLPAAATAVASGIVGSGSAVVASTTAAASSVATSAASSAAVVSSAVVASTATSSAISAGVTSSAVLGAASAAPFTNSTSPSTKKSKSACKNKSRTSSAAGAVFSTSTGVQVGAVVTSSSASSIFTTSAGSVTIATTTSAIETSAAVATTDSASTSTSTASAETSTIPSGTTLNTLLSWLSSFYNSVVGTSYTGETSASVSRRHARDLAARQMDSHSAGMGFHATGTAAGGFGGMPTGGFAHQSGSGHARHSGGFGGVRPTGSFSAGGAQASGFNFNQVKGFAKASGAFSKGSGSGHAHHTGSFGGVRPTGSFSAGGAQATGSFNKGKSFARASEGFSQAAASGGAHPTHHHHRPSGTASAGFAAASGGGSHFKAAGFF